MGTDGVSASASSVHPPALRRAHLPGQRAARARAGAPHGLTFPLATRSVMHPFITHPFITHPFITHPFGAGGRGAGGRGGVCAGDLLVASCAEALGDGDDGVGEVAGEEVGLALLLPPHRLLPRRAPRLERPPRLRDPRDNNAGYYIIVLLYYLYYYII